MIVLGLETSCDETAIALVRDGVEVLESAISSQVAVHRKYGGVVPELASRAHLESVSPLVERVLQRSGLTLADVDVLAVTQGPGLVGALMVGLQTARTLAIALDKPLVAVHHIAAHLAAVRLGRPELTLGRHVGLAVSGGHTALYQVDSPNRLTMIGQTLDDAAGEAFDKVASLLGLGYPGGRVVDELARTGRRDAVKLPRAALPKRPLDFSFSGLKTSVRTWVQKHGQPSGQALADLAASFQEAVCDVLVSKTLAAARHQGTKTVVVAGGVSCNTRLRARFVEEAPRKGVQVLLPEPRWCTDNAAMIAGLGYELAREGRFADPWTLDANPGLGLDWAS